MATFNTPNDFLLFAEYVKAKSRFVLDDDQRQFIDKIRATVATRVSVLDRGTMLWRAQHGCCEVIESPNVPSIYWPMYTQRTPWDEARMRPKMDRAKEGRANPKGIPCLYAADCRDTAMSEMRSWVGSYLSCAQFLTQLNLTIVDCSTKAPAFTSARHLMADEGAKAEHVWGTINDAFATPVSPTDDLADYAPTQYLAELFRSEGYDGLQFKSTVGAGFNIVLFRHESVSLEGSRVFKATSVQYKFEEINECV